MRIPLVELSVMSSYDYRTSWPLCVRANGLLAALSHLRVRSRSEHAATPHSFIKLLAQGCEAGRIGACGRHLALQSLDLQVKQSAPGLPAH